jgi:VacB/RNase II family 3'-5' exoribonuclease
MSGSDKRHRAMLQRIARGAMIEMGLFPDFSTKALTELAGIQIPARREIANVRDLTDLAWASIDNDDSRDLDQITSAEELTAHRTKVLVAIADVDAIVSRGSAIDNHARHNTTSVYTAAEIFPMLPDRLSTDLTSLNFNEDRLAVVVEMIIDAEGSVLDSDVYRACVRNHARLSYDSVAEWLDGGDIPEGVASVEGLADNLRIQDSVAWSMKDSRHVHGSLTLETVKARPIFDGDVISDLREERTNRAKRLVEEFMIAANGVTARYLATRRIPSLRRVVRTPHRWDRIVSIARDSGVILPSTPDSRALERFLIRAKAADPPGFPDLSLTVIKLIGSGEYVADNPGTVGTMGHFGLAVRDYTHSTAPNRRYPDLITQRLLKAGLTQQPVPYELSDLESLARHCTEMEDAVKKIERRVEKSAAAILLQGHIGAYYEAIVTGAAPKGTWVRLLSRPVEGKLVSGFEGLDVGRRIRVELVHTDIEHGFIDFRRVA